MIVIEPYNSNWPQMFGEIKLKVWPLVKDVATGIEHVGSTSVPGLAAKPVIDVDLIIESPDNLPTIIERLRQAGYEHRGNLGIEGRESFKEPHGSIRQNLYVCFADSVALKNHLILRDHLRKDPVSRKKYGELKGELAQEHGSIDNYVEGKTAFILSILSQYGVNDEHIASIREANRAKDG